MGCPLQKEMALNFTPEDQTLVQPPPVNENVAAAWIRRACGRNEPIDPIVGVLCAAMTVAGVVTGYAISQL